MPSASPLSEKIDNIRAMEQAGAAAVVFHSLFEEQIETAAPEFRIDPNTYLENITQAKRAVGIPIIGSLNCTTLGGWISYARRITEAGADALEVNIYRIPTRPEVTGSTTENIYIETVRSIRAATKIPLAIKLSPYFSSFANMAISLDDLNVDGLVLFNRFYQPDIDLEKMEVTPNFTLSTPADMRLPLHWIGILYGKVRCSLAAGRMAGGPWPQIIARAQRRHEPAKLPRPQRIRARAIRARPFQLHVAFSDATVSSSRVLFYRFRPSFVSATI